MHVSDKAGAPGELEVEIKPHQSTHCQRFLPSILPASVIEIGMIRFNCYGKLETLNSKLETRAHQRTPPP